MDNFSFRKFEGDRFVHKIQAIPWHKPCPQNILIVTDGYPGSFLNGSFNNYYFGLSAVIDTLLDQTDYFVKFKLTLAHRQIDSNKPAVPVTDPMYVRYGPNFENFRFTTTANDVKTGKPFDINAYDQIWLFGVRGNAGDTDRLNDPELTLLTTWMDKGGGLFATGDHADLGASMCSRVPRASKMRMWTTVTDINGNLKSPPQPTGPNRHDTLVKGHDATYTFDDESDDIPMSISPKFYYRWSFHPFYKTKFPHPVLCGKNGVINVLPDHPHEGEIIEENQVKLTESLINGSLEFPKIGGNHFKPEVIAHAHVQSDHTNASDLNKGAANAKTFGVIGAYDGYVTNVGRVVVDSTWHHWFDVNLTGRPIVNLDTPPFSAANPKTEGFLATPQGQAHYAKIQNYFINVGLWLAPKSDRMCMLKGMLWGYVVQYPAVERLHSKLSIIELGITAKDALGKIAGQCNVKSWLFEILPADVRGAFEKMNSFEPENCLTCPPEDLLEIYILGTITSSLLEMAYKVQDQKPEDEKLVNRINEEVGSLVVKGIDAGVKRMFSDLDKNLSITKEHLANMSKIKINIK